MKILALIPARGGSKRLTGKNLRLLGGKPLVKWSIDAVKDFPEVVALIVSTDDEEIASIAKRAGVCVPWLRPAELATDTASSVDVAIHALEKYEQEHGLVDGLLLLQPTSPFRSQATIRTGIDLFSANPDSSIIGVSPAVNHPLWCMRLEGERLKPYIESGGQQLRSQDLPPAYVVNGAFYLVPANVLRDSHTLYATNMLPIIMNSPEEQLDIDTEQDWRMAEQILSDLQ